MPHRGRLNVLAARAGQALRASSSASSRAARPALGLEGAGDVKYHLGASSDREFDGNSVHLSLTANPSHLEIVNPVVEGKAPGQAGRSRAREPDAGRGPSCPCCCTATPPSPARASSPRRSTCRSCPATATGGTIHIIVNNQIGFTTTPATAASPPYPTDVAKMIEAPIFHVNGDDPEAVVYRGQAGHRVPPAVRQDVMVDLVCYRRHGHNESDEPTLHPAGDVRARSRTSPSTRELYAERLIAEGDAHAGRSRRPGSREFDDFLDARDRGRQGLQGRDKADWLDGAVDGPRDCRRGLVAAASTGVPRERLKTIATDDDRDPEGFTLPHEAAQRDRGRRADAVEVRRGHRLGRAPRCSRSARCWTKASRSASSGQDSRRGTFSHRHAVLFDSTTGERYIPLNTSGRARPSFTILNTPAVRAGRARLRVRLLAGRPADAGALGGPVRRLRQRRPGRSSTSSSPPAESKWQRMSGLVMLLPHGYEGQGPEHSNAPASSASCSCAPRTTSRSPTAPPRRSTSTCCGGRCSATFRKPLVVMTPKTLLRHKRAVSNLADLAGARPSTACCIDEAEAGCDVATSSWWPTTRSAASSCARARSISTWSTPREKRGDDDVYLLRLEQLYPFPTNVAAQELAASPTPRWCGVRRSRRTWAPGPSSTRGSRRPCTHLSVKAKRARYVGRPASASTAAGLMKRHQAELDRVPHAKRFA